VSWPSCSFYSLFKECENPKCQRAIGVVILKTNNYNVFMAFASLKQMTCKTLRNVKENVKNVIIVNWAVNLNCSCSVNMGQASFLVTKRNDSTSALENYWYKVHTRERIPFIQTPIMLNKELWEVSGHWSYIVKTCYLGH
jgi:hypothetical protein